MKLETMEIEAIYKEFDDIYHKYLNRWEEGAYTNSKEANWEDFYEILCVAVDESRKNFPLNEKELMETYHINFNKL